MRANNLMAEFSFSNNKTLSLLHNTYYMSVYGSQLWRYVDHKSTIFYIVWRKTIIRIWRLHNRTHNVLLSSINKCLPIDTIKKVYEIISVITYLH